jgi:hypothetical protein
MVYWQEKTVNSLTRDMWWSLSQLRTILSFPKLFHAPLISSDILHGAGVEIPHFYRSLSFITMFTRAYHSFLSWTIWIQFTSTCSFNSLMKPIMQNIKSMLVTQTDIQLLTLFFGAVSNSECNNLLSCHTNGLVYSTHIGLKFHQFVTYKGI